MTVLKDTILIFLNEIERIRSEAKTNVKILIEDIANTLFLIKLTLRNRPEFERISQELNFDFKTISALGIESSRVDLELNRLIVAGYVDYDMNIGPYITESGKEHIIGKIESEFGFVYREIQKILYELLRNFDFKAICREAKRLAFKELDRIGRSERIPYKAEISKEFS
ncbi:MAG: hypothetical protein ACTSVW_02060 [Candidatus Njordarchaeales archaeon]